MSDYSFEADNIKGQQEILQDKWIALLTFKCRLSEEEAINEVVEDCGATIDKEKQCKPDNSNVAMTVSKLFDTKENAVAGANAIAMALKSCLSNDEITTEIKDIEELVRGICPSEEALNKRVDRKLARAECCFNCIDCCFSCCNII